MRENSDIMNPFDTCCKYKGGDVRMGVMEEIRRRINKIKRERWGQSKIRSWRRAIVMRGLSRGVCGVTGKSALAVEIAILFPELTLISI